MCDHANKLSIQSMSQAFTRRTFLRTVGLSMSALGGLGLLSAC